MSDEETDDTEFLADIRTFCDRANAWLRRHEVREHEGTACHAERGNLLAYVAHRIGLTSQAILVFIERFQDYARGHDQHLKGH